MTKVVAMMQPTYLPWIGYFELMDKSDLFVFLDDVQFSKGGWQQRNKIKTPHGPEWLTIPTVSVPQTLQRINEVQIDQSQRNWAAKHLRAFKLYYQKAPYFEQYFAALSQFYRTPWARLQDFTVHMILWIKGQLNINTPCITSSSLDIATTGNQRLIDICRKVGIFRFYDTAGAAAFIDSEEMAREGVEMIFQDYPHPVYTQQHGEFLPHMCALDLLFNEGPRSLEIIRSGSTFSS
jgi:hypothetical protein